MHGNHLSVAFLLIFMDDTYFYFKCLFIILMLSIKQHLLTHSMQHRPFCKANRSPAAQGVPCILQNPKVHFQHSHVPANSLYPDEARSSPCPHNPPPEDPSQHYLAIYTCVSQVVSYLQLSAAKHCIHLSCSHTCYMPRLTHSSLFHHPNNIG